MSFENPTSIRLGQSGTIAGIKYQVVGRVVLGMEEEGEIYYWHEFNVVNEQGGFATLVYEEGENSADWKLFTLFEPQNPISVAEARTKRVGETVNLHGSALPVTVVDESRVYFIEGQAPEGVEVGDVAQYFNAERGQWMLVVSWTGEELEVYRGMNLPRGAVEKAFGASPDSQPGINHLKGDDTSTTSSFRTIKIVVSLFIIGMVMVAAMPRCSPTRRSAPSEFAPPPTPAQAPQAVSIGQKGELFGTNYQVTGHFTAEIAWVGSSAVRHEYLLKDEGNQVALLVQNFRQKSRDWGFFTPCRNPPLIAPVKAGALKWGEVLDIDGQSARVTQMFQTTTWQKKSAGSNSVNNLRSYGVMAESRVEFFLIRWNQQEVTCHRGVIIPEATVLAAFK